MTVKYRVSTSRLVSAMGAQLSVMDDGSVVAQFVMGEAQEGPPGYSHGGALAALLDETMGACAWAAGYQVVAAHLDFDYQRPVPIGTSIRAEARIERVEGRKVFTASSVLLPNGETAVAGTGVFVVAPHFFTHGAGFTFTAVEDDQ
jgi:uncharacterized protein (TIGR00369 family)